MQIPEYDKQISNVCTLCVFESKVYGKLPCYANQHVVSVAALVEAVLSPVLAGNMFQFYSKTTILRRYAVYGSEG